VLTFLRLPRKFHLTQAKVEELASDDTPSSDQKYTPEVELKHLPSSLSYEFVGPNSTYRVIVNANLSASQLDSLLRVLQLHSKAIRYTIDDLKGIHPSVYALNFDAR